MINKVIFLQDIILQVGNITFSSDKFDVSASITENEENPRRAILSIYNVTLETEKNIFTIGQKVSISIYWYSTGETDVLYNGIVTDAYKVRVGSDIRFDILSDDGHSDVLNSYGVVNASKGEKMIDVVNKMVANSGIALGEFPDSLNKPHPSGRPYNLKGNVEDTVSKYLGSQYRISYKNNTINIFDKNQGYKNVYSISNAGLYDFPMRRVKRKNKDSKDLENNRKNFIVKSIPKSYFTIGTNIRVSGSDYIDDSPYIITSVDMVLDKLQSVATLVLSEKGKTTVE